MASRSACRHTILAHSNRKPSCARGRCNVTWDLEPKTPAEASAVVEFVKTVANGHEVYATLLPGNSEGGERFTEKLTDEQLLGFHDAKQYYDSLILVKKVARMAQQQ